MNIEIVQAKSEWVPEIVQAMKTVGLNPNAESLRSYFFDVPLSESSSSIRGGVVVRDGTKIVGYCGLAPMRIYLDHRPYDGYQMGVLGVMPGYGACMFDIMDFIHEAIQHSYDIGNTANAKSVRLFSTYGGFVSGPEQGAYINYRFLPLGALTWPRICPENNSISEFSDFRFEAFWKHFLLNSEGPFSSREPEKLQRIFGRGLVDGKFVLLTEHNDELVLGYMIIRRKQFMKTPYKRFEIVDVAAVGHKYEILDRLFRRCITYTKSHGGVMLEYIGAGARIMPLVEKYLPRRRAALANTFLWASSIPELTDAFRNNRGWFFGPFDGDRCK